MLALADGPLFPDVARGCPAESSVREGGDGLVVELDLTQADEAKEIVAPFGEVAAVQRRADGRRVPIAVFGDVGAETRRRDGHGVAGACDGAGDVALAP